MSVYLYKCSGRLATASESILTHEYTAVICIADLSLTAFPLADEPSKKLYPLPAVAFLGASLLRNILLIIPIFLSPFKNGMKKHLPLSADAHPYIFIIVFNLIPTVASQSDLST